MLEKDDLFLPYRPAAALPREVTQSQIFEEILRPTARFRKPFTSKERLRLLFSRMALKASPFNDISISLSSSVPLNWQVVLNYLFREGIIEAPVADFRSLRNDKPKVLGLSIRAKHDANVTDAINVSLSGSSIGPDFETSLSKAIGELLERYMGTIFKFEKLQRATPQKLRESNQTFLNPKSLNGYTEWQKARNKTLQYDDATPFYWAEAVNLTNANRKTLVPAQLLFWVFNAGNRVEPTLMPLTTNGGAGHFSREEALLAALREYVQRDAFLIYWLNTLSPKRIQIQESTEPQVTELLSYLKHFNITAYFLDITSDLPVPTCACVLIHDENGEDPYMTLGAGNGATALDAILSSYNEAIAAQSAFDGWVNTPKVDLASYIPFARTDIDRDGRIALWRGKEWYEKIRFFLSGDPEPYSEFASKFTPYASPKEELAFLIDHFKARGAGYEIYAHYFEHNVLRSLGYHVVKLVIPKLIPMYLNEHLVTLEAERLRAVPKVLGYVAPEPNIYPHPFP